MNKKQFVEALAEDRFEGDKKDAEYAIDSVVDGIMRAMTEEDVVDIFGFGKFTATEVAARTGRNPQTGEPVEIAASIRLGFKAAAGFKRVVNDETAELAELPGFIHRNK